MTDSAWSDNVRRILGMHDLEKGEAARLLGVSAQAVSRVDEQDAEAAGQGSRTSRLCNGSPTSLSFPVTWHGRPSANYWAAPSLTSTGFTRVEKKILRFPDTASGSGVTKDRQSDKRKASSFD